MASVGGGTECGENRDAAAAVAVKAPASRAAPFAVPPRVVTLGLKYQTLEVPYLRVLTVHRGKEGAMRLLPVLASM